MSLEILFANEEALAELERSFASGPIEIIRGKRFRISTAKKIGRINGLSVHIFSREHPPPHFRVTFQGESADFQIKDCAPLTGGLSDFSHNIREWHKNNKQHLIDEWNGTRPTGCPVGPYKE